MIPEPSLEPEEPRPGHGWPESPQPPHMEADTRHPEEAFCFLLLGQLCSAEDSCFRVWTGPGGLSATSQHLHIYLGRCVLRGTCHP